MEHVILVDTHDNEIGTMEKLEAHKKGVLHRAFSVVLFDGSGNVLLQKRSQDKYHSKGLWTNTCCSHPLPGEAVADGARRRLREEMGIDLQPTFSHSFIYKAELDNGLTEHEFDHVFFGSFDGEPLINTTEVEDWKYVNVRWLKEDMISHPGNYTVWFRHIMNHPAFNAIGV